ncbi:MAG: hypothetical protein AAGU15_02790 [Anaerolineaceae bacterium]|mgnify:CR=1 FL=1|jgi:uncharacterized membrane protein YraQ (UPF0718 family)
MKKSFIFILIPTVILALIAYFVGGIDLVLDGLTVASKTAGQSSIMLIVSFVLIGQLNILITKEILDGWLQKFSGIKGIIISAFAGGLFPGGPYIYYPFIQSFNNKGIPFYIFIAFIMGKNVYDISRVPMEISLVDPKISLVRYLVTLPIPILIAMITRRFFQGKAMDDVFISPGEKE